LKIAELRRNIISPEIEANGERHVAYIDAVFKHRNMKAVERNILMHLAMEAFVDNPNENLGQVEIPILNIIEPNGISERLLRKKLKALEHRRILDGFEIKDGFLQTTINLTYMLRRIPAQLVIEK
jgi:hypothetical protein